MCHKPDSPALCADTRSEVLQAVAAKVRCWAELSPQETSCCTRAGRPDWVDNSADSEQWRRLWSDEPNAVVKANPAWHASCGARGRTHARSTRLGVHLWAPLATQCLPAKRMHWMQHQHSTVQCELTLVLAHSSRFAFRFTRRQNCQVGHSMPAVAPRVLLAYAPPLLGCA